MAWAQRHLGFDRRALRLERLRASAEKEAARLGWAGFEAALQEGEEGVDEALTEAATVGETYFFRQPEHFELLSRLPFRGSAELPLRAWSAACSSGEEAYSLALALRQQLALEAPALEVWGTDINRAALQHAAAAAYGKWSFRPSVFSGGDSLLSEAARTAALRQQMLDPLTRACVRFARHNLLEDPRFDGGAGPRFHLIFCRNALVYFSPAAAIQALEHLRDALLPGGWLVLGNMDIAATPKGMRPAATPRLCVFERVETAIGVSAPRTEVRMLPSSASASLLQRRQPPAEGGDSLETELAVDWHRAVLALLDLGRMDQAIADLDALLERFPQYLPGYFEHGLALSRHGQKERAVASLGRVLELARRWDPRHPVPGPEALSLDFYVSNAEAFIQSQGQELP
jgi:chemotaxis protein methyltransferase CheR